MTDDYAIEGEDAGYVPCFELPAVLVVEEEGAISGRGTGRVARNQSAASLPAPEREAIVGSGVGFVPGPCLCGGNCIETFNRVETAGLGTSDLVGSPVWLGATSCSANGSEAVIPTAAAPRIDPPDAFTQPIEILTRQRFFRGTVPSGSFSGSPPGSDPQPTDRDIAARLELRRDSSIFANPIVWLGLLMDHGDHGGILASDLQLELGYHDAFDTIVTLTIDNPLPDIVWSRFRVQSLSAFSSTIKAKAWAEGDTEPDWQLSLNASWTSGLPQPTSPAQLLMLDNRVGALDTVWYVDSICVVSGLPCTN